MSLEAYDRTYSRILRGEFDDGGFCSAVLDECGMAENMEANKMADRCWELASRRLVGADMRTRATYALQRFEWVADLLAEEVSNASD